MALLILCCIPVIIYSVFFWKIPLAWHRACQLLCIPFFVVIAFYSLIIMLILGVAWVLWMTFISWALVRRSAKQGDSKEAEEIIRIRWFRD